MNINIKLSEESINAAIRELRNVQENLRWGLEQTIDILVKEGTEIAQRADGSMANVTGYMPDENIGLIDVTGDVPLIAEFGAGDATLEPGMFFENQPDTPVYPGSYSLLEGTGEYYLTRLEWGETGIWHFGGIPYSAIEPRQGLFKAKEHIKQVSTETAKEVIKL